MDRDSLINSVKQINGIQGAMIVSKDGLVLANSASDIGDPNLVSAILSSMFTNIDVQSKRMQRGKLKRFTIETENDALSIMEVNINGEHLLLFSQFGKTIELENLNKSLDNILQKV